MKSIKYNTDELEIDLQLRGQITLLQGNTAAGKSYLFNVLKGMDCTDNLYFINYNMATGNENVKAIVDYITNNSDKVILIDQSDDIFELHPELEETIAEDYKNQYIIIGRNPELIINPSCVSELHIENRKATLHYLFPEPLTR